MEKINVNLYNGTIYENREQPMKAEILYCSCKDKCSLYKENKCLNCGTSAKINCHKGKAEFKQGYTKKAKKYNSFKEKYENDETYNKLNYPLNKHFAVIDDCLWFCLRCVKIYKPTKDDENYSKINEWGYYINENNVYSYRQNLLLPYNEVNIDFLHQILSYQPQKLCDKIDYEQEIIPSILKEMKTLTSELYNQLIKKYPEYERTEINYIKTY